MFRELGDRAGEGRAFKSLSQYDKATEFHTKSLNISHELGDTARKECLDCEVTCTCAALIRLAISILISALISLKGPLVLTILFCQLHARSIH